MHWVVGSLHQDRMALDDEIEEAKAYGIKAAITAAVVIPVLLIMLDFLAACFKIDFKPAHEWELITLCVGALVFILKVVFGHKDTKTK